MKQVVLSAVCWGLIGGFGAGQSPNYGGPNGVGPNNAGPIHQASHNEPVDLLQPAGRLEAPVVGRSMGSTSSKGKEESGLEGYLTPEKIGGSLQLWIGVAVMSLAPALLMMTTCFVRVSVVLGLLRQALGAAQLPSNQVVTALAMFLTLLVMAPVWRQSYEQGVRPYTEQRMSREEAWTNTVAPIRRFMSLQIEATGRRDCIWLFHDYAYPQAEDPASYDDVPLEVLLPAFLLGELQTAFLIGFQIFLPFVVLDLVVSTVLTSMGMMMTPPAAVSLPLKLLLFVMVDGWQLVVGMLLQSFVPFS